MMGKMTGSQMKRVLALLPVSIALLLISLYVIQRPLQVDSSLVPSEQTSVVSPKIEGVVKPGETMFDIFKNNGLDLNELFRLEEATADVHRLREIATGQPYKIELGPDNVVLSLTYQINDDELLTITRSDPGFRAEKITLPYETKERKLGGVIESNLYDALGNDGEAAMLAYGLSDIFSWDIDFTTDLRKGDTFKIVVEELWRDGRFHRYGNILAAEFTNDGNTHRAFRYEEQDGRAGYYDEEGYFFITDRLKRMINASGFKVWPAEVEAMLYAHPDIREACVIGTRDPYRGETVKALIVLEPAARDRVKPEDITTWAHDHMAAFKVPRVVEFVEALPKTATGKVFWRELQEAENRALAART